MATWHVVTDAEGKIWGTFGETLLFQDDAAIMSALTGLPATPHLMAQDLAKEIESKLGMGSQSLQQIISLPVWVDFW